MTKMNLYLKDKKVLFVTTKNLDYLRNVQEIHCIEEEALSMRIIGSQSRKYISRLLHVYKELLFLNRKDYDTIFLGFEPQLVLPIFAWKFKKQDIVVDFFISVYDTFVFDRKKFKEGGILARIAKWVDTATLRRADYVISDTNAHGDYFAEEFGCDRAKIETMYLTADTSIYYPMDVPKSEELKDKFVVFYFGSILPLQGVDVIIKSAKLLQEQTDIQYVIVGPMKDEDKLDLANVTYISWLEQKELARQIAMADLCLAGHFNADIAKAKRTIPGKTFIYVAMNKTIILGDNPANHELYEESDRYYYVPMGNAQALADKIVEVKMKR